MLFEGKEMDCVMEAAEIEVGNMSKNQVKSDAPQCTRCFLSPAELFQSAETTIYFALITLFQQFRKFTTNVLVIR